MNLAAAQRTIDARVANEPPVVWVRVAAERRIGARSQGVSDPQGEVAAQDPQRARGHARCVSAPQKTLTS